MNSEFSSPPPPVPINTPGPPHDFDFLMGRWDVRNRRLRERLRGSTGWDEFYATLEARPLLNGLGNEDEYRTAFWPDFVGMSFRFFNPLTRQWSIYWADSRRGALDPPVVGTFTGDVGVFEGTDTFEGHAIRVRFTWSGVTTPTPRWEQAFSADDGRTWETNWVMDFRRPCCGVVELRQYTTHPGQRDALIDLFDREFVESQEAVDMTVMGQFRDLGNPDRFVWLRGFRDMDSRPAALTAFYGGPVWQAHRSEANATMVDSDNVLLLRPAWPDAGVAMTGRSRDRRDDRPTRGVVDATIFYLAEPVGQELLEFCRGDMSRLLAEAGADVLGWYVTESSSNNFPALPVREGEFVLVGLAAFSDTSDLDALVQSGAWARRIEPALSRWLKRPSESLRLRPTRRSAIYI